MAAPPPQPPPRGGGMSLYANLLDTDGAASISRDPVLFKNDDKDDAPAARKAINPALRFQPIRRPQITKPSSSSSSSKPKPKPAFPKAPAAATLPPSSSLAAAAIPPTSTAPAQNRNTLADWTATTEDDEYLYSHGGTGEKRQRGGRRKKKNKRGVEDVPRETDWDELYDPARPTNVEEYLRSEERVREVRDWRAVLYAHRRGRASSARGGGSERGRDSGSEGEGEGEGGRGGLRNQFAPPASFTFAPPPMSPPRAAVAVAAASVPDAATGDDAYARRLALSGMAPPPPATAAPSPIPPPPPPTDTDSTTISRAPIRYSQPPPNPDAMDVDIPKPDDADYDPEVDYTSILVPPTTNFPKQEQDQQEAERTTRPGQQGFAQRLMAKYGWTKGTGLGASQSGITSALRVQVEKRKRKPDAEGGGFVAGSSGGRGKIIAPKSKAKSTPNPNINTEEGGAAAGGPGGKFGKMSVVVVLDKMLDGMPDVEAEVEAGLGQEIGEECGERYGRVERIVVDVEGGRVFIRFVEGVSALRAVNALEGRIFNGNAITARFYNEEQFEDGVYDG